MTNIPMLATSYLDPLNLQAYEHPQKESLISTLRLILEDPSGKKCREELRESFEESQKSEPNPEIICTNFNVSYADQDVRTYIFRQKDLTGCLPVIFFIHGGGWAVGR
jgi:acetyl esterase/lipase